MCIKNHPLCSQNSFISTFVFKIWHPYSLSSQLVTDCFYLFTTLWTTFFLHSIINYIHAVINFIIIPPEIMTNFGLLSVEHPSRSQAQWYAMLRHFHLTFQIKHLYISRKLLKVFFWLCNVILMDYLYYWPLTVITFYFVCLYIRSFAIMLNFITSLFYFFSLLLSFPPLIIIVLLFHFN